jgi:hypothetical protein
MGYVTSAKNRAARYKKALENIVAHVPYAYAKELARNALDLEAELIAVHERTNTSLGEKKDGKV